jgi:predicted Rossmann-fold nucleotide-binding protein
MSLPYRNIAVFCGPQDQGANVYNHAAELLGFSLGKRNVSLAAGGQKELVSKFSRAAKSEDADLVAYFAEQYDDGCRMSPPYKSHLVGDDKLRHAMLVEKADMMVALPGEFDAACAFGQSGRPVIIVNMNGQFKKARSLMDQAVADGKIGHNSAGKIHWARCIDEAMDIFDHLQLRAL